MIWTFGDSFSKHFKPSKYFNHLEDSWIERTATILGHKVTSNSKPLLTLEHIYYNFNNIRNKLHPNDIIIITVTNVDRRWFWRNTPLKILFLDDIEQHAVTNYKELHDLQEIYFTNFLYNLNHITKKLNLHTIVLPCFLDGEELVNSIKDNFDAIHFGNIALGTASGNEFKKDLDFTELFNDDRVNHFCRDNHIILSNKIIDNIQTKTPIDLTTGFKQHFYDNNISQDQLFDGIMPRLMRIKINRP